MDYQSILEDIYKRVKEQENQGALATYIPELTAIDPEKFGIHLSTVDQQHYSVGDADEKFSIQSIVKVLSLCLAYKLKGEALWQRLGYEPSGTAFNSLVQLESDRGIPRNPLINAGALVICDILLSSLIDARKDFLHFVRNISGNPGIDYSPRIVESEKSSGFVNIALCNYIKSFGNIHNECEDVLDFYFNLCSIELSCRELCSTFMILANGGRKVHDNEAILTLSQVKRINAIMQTCGLYDESGDFAYRVGLPGKSGVGGGIIALHPGMYCITTWSPRLNKKGNSFRGIKFLEEFTTITQMSIF